MMTSNRFPKLTPVLCLLLAAGCSTAQKRDVAAVSDAAARDDARSVPADPYREIPVVSVPALDGLQARLCVGTEIATECWQHSISGYVYVTAGNLRIHRDCLDHPDEKIWKGFPDRPAAFVKAADDVVAAVNGCVRSLNPGHAAGLARFIRDERPMIECDPRAQLTARTERGSPYIVLADPKAHDLPKIPFDSTGQGFRAILLQELLHAKGDLENLSLERRNDRRCRPHDAAYALAWMCFPARNYTHEVTQAACDAALAPDRARKACDPARAGVVRVQAAAADETAYCVGEPADPVEP
jgi:hypothetical protein